MKDTANEVGSLENCLYSTGNRVKIANILLRLGEEKLLYTILEDLYVGAQLILDTYCVDPPKEP